MIKGHLFTKEKLKKLASKFNFIYEPDESKCKSHYRIPVMFITFYVKDGIVEYGEPGFATTIINTKEQCDMDWILEYSPVKYINCVYVEIFDQEDQNKLNDWNKNYHGHIWVKVCGHTSFTDENPKETV